MKTWFGNLRLAGKLGLGFGICLALATILGVSALSGLKTVGAALHKVANESVLDFTALGKFDGAARQVRILQYRAASSHGNSADKEILADIAEQRREAIEGLDDYETRLINAEDKEAFASLKATWTEYLARWDRIQNQVLDSNSEVASAVLEKELTPLFVTKIRPQLKTVLDFNQNAVHGHRSNAEAALSTATRTVVVMLVLAIVIGSLFAWLVSRATVRPILAVANRLESLQSYCIADLAAGIRGLAEGDLTIEAKAVTTPVPIAGHDEVGRMAISFNAALTTMQGAIEAYNEARTSLSLIVSQVAENAASMASTSQTLAASGEQSGSAANEIAAGSQKLAISASESAATMEQLAAQVVAVGQSSGEQRRQVDTAEEALTEASAGIDGVAASAKSMESAAADGNTAVRQTVEAMGRVREQAALSSAKVRELDARGREIGDIVRTIEGIAEQTNLLALNAAIEAARAGDHGRGFAVVADEVRKLAEQARNSTKQIGELIAGVRSTVSETVKAIEATSHEVETGAQRSEQAGRALDEILAVAQQVSHQASGVASLTRTASEAMHAVSVSSADNESAADEMARGSDRVVGSITGVAAISEESAAGAEELSASIEEVGAAAHELAEMSENLQALVSRFHYEEVQTSTPRLRVAA